MDRRNNTGETGERGAGLRQRAGQALVVAGLSMLTATSAVTTAAAQSQASTGTGFVVDQNGFAVTNAHVIAGAGNGCRGLVARRGLERFKASIVAHDVSNDLALVRIDGIGAGSGAPSESSQPAPRSTTTSAGGRSSLTGDDGADDDNTLNGGGSAAASASPSTWVATIRTGGDPVEQGEQIYAIGYPFGSALSNEHKITQGLVSSLSGLRGDVSKFQMSAQINPGNSGGPVLDESGNVVGVSVSGHVKRTVVVTLDAKGNPKPGLVTQASDGIKFAIRHDTLLAFLNAHGVNYRTAPRSGTRRATDLAKQSGAFTVQLLCIH